MKKRFLSLLLLTACLAALLCSSVSQAASYPYTGIAGKDGANLREQADLNGRIILVIHPNELVTVTGRTGEWFAVSHMGKKGYVHKNRISFFSEMVFDEAEIERMFNPEYAGEDAFDPDEAEGMFVRVGKGGANLRNVMNLEAKPVRILHAGEEVYVYCVVTVSRHDWAVVVTKDGTYGYVSAGYLDWETDDDDD